MESMNSPQDTGIMVKLRNRKGFSLVEMSLKCRLGYCYTMYDMFRQDNL